MQEALKREGASGSAVTRICDRFVDDFVVFVLKKNSREKLEQDQRTFKV